ncbi:hypothetical protein T265_08567 [Opisthorchis viverrini]|uniref:BTB domain-containing protein n=1 Tax=Opisthorchis viverrini TaxID=6198 RepID=A0A074ZJN6_OPIVI|nr:hypothetical protein T265_08567 [Opisthorchis viverrini]KER23575.1 hypothetical protein T265_08567 [Opisthorchis viverrini]
MLLSDRLVSTYEIVHLNVGGRKFSTSRNTLLWSGDSFFSVLLGGRIPSCKDEDGAYFIDRDPDLFAVILNYLRTRELNVSGIDPITLRNEAEFYGLDSLVKKLSLCEEVFTGNCGDLLFHGYFPSPFLRTEELKIATENPQEPIPKPTVSDATTNRDRPSPTTSNTAPVTLIACHQNLMAVVYQDCVGVFHLKDPTGWHLVWLSPSLSAPIDRLALTTKHTGTVGLGVLFNPQVAVGSGASSFSAASSGPTIAPAVQQNIAQPVQGSLPSVPTSFSTTGASSPSMTSCSSQLPAQAAQAPPVPPHQSAPSPTAPGISASGCMVAAAVGSTISVWCLYPPPSSVNPAVASLGGVMGVSISPATYGLSPAISFMASGVSGTTGHFNTSLPRSNDPWASELIGRFDLNKRAVDYLMFIGAKLVALSRRGLVGVRHLVTNTWQVWSTVPILSYSVAASELLLLGCANGRICSINIQKFPLRIGDNDLLVTEIYRDPLQDPITALSVHFTHKTGQFSCHMNNSSLVQFLKNARSMESLDTRAQRARDVLIRQLTAYSHPTTLNKRQNDLSLNLKGRVYQATVRAILLYGCETWPIRAAELRRLQVFDSRLRTIARVSWCRRIRNEAVRKRVFGCVTASSGRNCMEIAYGTLSGRVCLIVQYPENVGYSPQLLQTFTVHRAMVTRVVLSEKHLISVCNDFNHVRTWAVTRFRGIISTQPGSTPIASFHITTLDVTNPQTLTDSVIEAAQLCATATRLSNPSRDIVRTHSQVIPTSAEQTRCPSQSQAAFRFSQWRRRTSHSRSPGSTLDRNDPTNPVSQPVDLTPSSPPMPASIVYTQVDRSQSLGRSDIVSPTDSGNFAQLRGSTVTTDIVVLPRTSWLHEDPGSTSARTSVVTNGAQGNSLHDPQPMERLQHSSAPGEQPNLPTVGRCQTFHGPPMAPIVTPDSTVSPSPLPVYRNPRTDKNRSTPIIELHRYANDPGPYGEREDILVFVQKFTPNATQLFVRFGATGKRVCVIRSVDGTPISSFCVHEHDGSNRVGAHPRRYIFTGHTDGSVQVWDLTTALNSMKCVAAGLAPGNPLLGFDGSFSPDLSTSGTVSLGVASNPTVSITPGSIGPLGVLPHNATHAPSQSAYLTGGPTSRELVRLLESCRLGTSTTPSLAGYSPGRLTPADSFSSICPNGPITHYLHMVVRKEPFEEVGRLAYAARGQASATYAL